MGAVLFAALMLTVAPRPVAAHPGVCADPSTQLLELTFAGPYIVSVGVKPAGPAVGPLQMVVGVCDGDTLLPVEGAQVDIRPVSPSGRAQPVVQGHSRELAVEEYEAALTLTEPGPWVYAVHIESGMGPADVQAKLDVLPGPASASSGADGVALLMGVNAGLLALAGFFVWQLRQRAAAPEAEGDE